MATARKAAPVKRSPNHLDATPPDDSTVDHQVTANLKNWELAKRECAVEFTIKNRKGKLGTLKVGRGSLSWTPRDKQTSVTKSWPDFAKLMKK
jgi:hypothetical protein